MDAFATAAADTWAIWLFGAFLTVVALFLLWATNRGHFAPWQDHQERNAYAPPADVAEWRNVNHLRGEK